MSEHDGVRTLLLAHQGVKSMLPHAAVAEIISFRKLDSLDSSTDIGWILGLVNWYGFRVPVISVEMLLGKPFKEPGQKAKIAICNLLDNERSYPAVGLVVEVIPRLFMIEANQQLLADEGSNDCALPVLYKGESVWIPDLARIGDIINAELGALPA